jgi:hypothetical protein
MSSFMWDVFGSHELPEVRADPAEAAVNSDSPGYSPPPDTLLREMSRAPDVPLESPPKTPVGLGDAETLYPQEICSSLSAKAVGKACASFQIGSDWCARPARSEERMCTYYEGEMAVLLHNIRMGLRFPLNSFFQSLFSVYELMPCQLTPNAYRCIVGFLEICRRQEIVPTVDLFHLIFQTIPSSNPVGWYYFRFRMSAHTSFLRGRSSSVHNWKDKFFFLAVPAGWSFNREWGEPSRRAMAKPDPTLSEGLKTARLKFGNFRGTIDVSRPSDEMLADIARYLRSLEGSNELSFCFLLLNLEVGFYSVADRSHLSFCSSGSGGYLGSRSCSHAARDGGSSCASGGEAR